ncbi:MAG TPA: IS66 family insertion sequence element accessory protein TnpB, partial [Candidatus Paceibacterota bacterium]|nr:IS66 family insertion sequence element accessory protein TnpB [Candidatus Paceibacterota bacterium]
VTQAAGARPGVAEPISQFPLLGAGFIDGRRGFNGLYTLVKETLHQEPTSGYLFVFLNNRMRCGSPRTWSGRSRAQGFVAR